MTVTVRFALEAERTLDAIEARWNGEHGLLRENPLLAEVSRTAERLRANPELGVIHRRPRRDSLAVRRLLLSTGWHLYYTYDPTQAHVMVIAISYARRGKPPL